MIFAEKRCIVRNFIYVENERVYKSILEKHAWCEVDWHALCISITH